MLERVKFGFKTLMDRKYEEKYNDIAIPFEVVDRSTRKF